MIQLLVTISVLLLIGLLSNKKAKEAEESARKSIDSIPDLAPASEDQIPGFKDFWEKLRNNLDSEDLSAKKQDIVTSYINSEGIPTTLDINKQPVNKSKLPLPESEKESTLLAIIEEDFDLEKAVIYSEILRPKYKDWD